jgi:cation diffusion facilitator CzcD-associated flavoprotein CzcO
VEVTEKVIQIRQDGLVTADGVRHRADPVIVATGFTAAEFLAPMIAAGAPGQDPRRLWRDATDSYLWLNIAGLPNLFMLHGVQQPRARRDRLRAPGPRLVVRAVCAGPPQPGAHPDAGARRG